MKTPETPKGKAVVIPAKHGRRMFVLGNEITVKLAQDETGGEFHLFETLTPPGVGVPLHVHQHEDEIVQVIDGELEIFIEGRTYKVKPGDVINFPRLVPHGFRNIGRGPARTLFTVIPGRNFEKFFEELSALRADDPPDMERVAKVFARYDIEILAPHPAQNQPERGQNHEESN